jgi:hypothetical protein
LSIDAAARIFIGEETMRSVLSESTTAIPTRLTSTDIDQFIYQYEEYQQQKKYQLALAVEYEAKLHGINITKEIQKGNDEMTLVQDGIQSIPYELQPGKDENVMGRLNETVHKSFNDVLHHSRNKQMILDAEKRIKQLLIDRAQLVRRIEKQQNDEHRKPYDILLQCLDFELKQAYGIVVDDDSNSYRIQLCDSIVSKPISKNERNEPEGKPTVNAAKLHVPLVTIDRSYQKQIDDICKEWIFPEDEQEEEEEDNNSLTSPLSQHQRIQRIHYLIQEETQKRSENKLLEANAIEYELWKSYNVVHRRNL